FPEERPPLGVDDTYMMAPPPSGEVISLSVMKDRIAEVAAELAHDDSDAYRECVVKKYEHMRLERNWPGDKGREFTLWNLAPVIESGLPAGAEIDRRDFLNPYPDPAPTWLEGTDSSLFGVTAGTSTTDGFEQAEIISTTRPLPDGEYSFDIKESWPEQKSCNFVVNNEVRVTVTSSSGALHEFFFDPFTVGSAVAADATNGVLKPTSFTTTDGEQATVESMSYDSGRVRVKVVPWDELSGVLDVIELDGTVSTSLRVTSSAVDVGSNTFTWSVSSQPWEDGDRLMVRIRPAAPFAPAPHRLSATTMGSDSIGLSWESVSGVTGHVVEQRVSGVARWESVDTDVKEQSHTVSGLWCGTTYEFRVSAHGDGTQYETVPGPGVSHHATVSETTEACSAQESPAFANAAYSFSIVEDAQVGSTVGSVSATDPQDDAVTYSITSGNEGERFAIDGSTGLITLAGTLDHDTASSHTLTAQAADGSGGRGSATVTVMVELASCAGGTAVPSPADNPGLVDDCLALLAARDALEGTVVLNWSADLAMGGWQAVGVA
ncbi:MAG: cadherin domain-containing protein, partial [Chloroflexi bacterium]|nr:cadherin domain-containing protein [Chloroflexota bacterium]